MKCIEYGPFSDFSFKITLNVVFKFNNHHPSSKTLTHQHKHQKLQQWLSSTSDQTSDFASRVPPLDERDATLYHLCLIIAYLYGKKMRKKMFIMKDEEEDEKKWKSCSFHSNFVQQAKVSSCCLHLCLSLCVCVCMFTLHIHTRPTRTTAVVLS